MTGQARKVDFKKSLDSYSARRGTVRVLEVPPLQYLMIDGEGDPNTAPAFVEAVEALYPIAYALKFAVRAETGLDAVVMPLEGLWWADDYDTFTSARDKSRWSWTLLIMVSDEVTPQLFEAAVAKAGAKSDARSAALGRVRLETLDEGLSVQTLHLGSFDDEAPVLQEMHDEFIPGEGLRMRGLHHEIYLSDARRVEPARRRTILRQPVVRA